MAIDNKAGYRWNSGEAASAEGGLLRRLFKGQGRGDKKVRGAASVEEAGSWKIRGVSCVLGTRGDGECRG